jgi:hypothetical protein
MMIQLEMRDAVRLNAPQIGGDEYFCRDARVVAWHARPQEDFTREFAHSLNGHIDNVIRHE